MKNKYRVLFIGFCIVLGSGCSGSIENTKREIEDRYPVGAQIDSDVVTVSHYQIPLPGKKWEVIWSNAKSSIIDPMKRGDGSSGFTHARMVLKSQSQPYYLVYFDVLLELAHNYYINDDRPCVSMEKVSRQQTDMDTLFDKQCVWAINAPFASAFPLGSLERIAVNYHLKAQGRERAHFLGVLHKQQRNKDMRIIYAIPRELRDDEAAWGLLQEQKNRAAEYF